MIINDPVYGKQKITDPCVLEIIKTKAFQRLKGIKQSGILAHLGDKQRRTTRYEHCIGVYLLLRKFMASREEQIAGLLHDLPHTAFSHVADFVFGNGIENYHEILHDTMLLNSEIPAVLKKYRFNVNRFLDDKNFPLLEQELPELCADRIDYLLRDAMEMGLDMRFYLPYIKIYKERFVFTDESKALHFAIAFKSMNELLWENAYKSSIYFVTASILKKALKENIITKDDFLETDDHVLNKIRNSNNAKLKRHLDALKEYAYEGESEYSFKINVRGKYIDPMILKMGELVRLSSVDKGYSSMIRCYKDWMKQGYAIRLKKK